MRELHVNVAGLDFFGDAGPFLLGPDGFEGWDEGVDMRLEKTGRPQAHGSFDLPGFQESRVVSLSGNVLADSPAQLSYLKERLLGVLAGGQSGRIQVARPWGTQWANCRLGARTRFTERGGKDSATFQMQLWCPDPRKFGELRTYVASVGSNVTAFHRGNYDAVPRLVVAGSMPGGYVLTLRGQVFVVTEPLLSGQPHSIDYGDGRLRIGGSIVHGGLGYGFTPLVPPGNVTALAIAPRTTGTATATLTLFDTYI